MPIVKGKGDLQMSCFVQPSKPKNVLGEKKQKIISTDGQELVNVWHFRLKNEKKMISKIVADKIYSIGYRLMSRLSD